MPRPKSTPSEASRGAGQPPQNAAWRVAAGQGDYARAYALLGANGYARAVAGARGAEPLLVLADMARSVSEPAQAALALELLVQRHPRDSRAALAALTLGKLQLDALGRPETACETFQHAIELGLPGALQEDALARLVEACARAGKPSVARRGAAEYRRRFPQGRWRARIDTWAGAP
jgi:transmembrane sensor